ncbi:PP2C family protein-serine/threonine phosphatase [Ramlibacter humi]|uniref:Response regulator n=1 Tax=Ramlibacter humi TaxID=2530451 RepID=A0A4Z0BE03_9BURK|nr:SpoIIE family protein phosphatase [Ramlibacter humi]TFY96703.1 response regulator [Ramlibacter humi]
MPAAAVHALVADDDPMLLALLEAFLQTRGYAVTACGDGLAALEQFERGGFNLLITDRNMPRMDGLALCRAVRARDAGRYVYCIMLTASDEEDTLVAAMEAGVDDFVLKPLRPAELGARLRAAERVLALEAGLAARNEELARAYAQLSRDLELARTLQLGQLPAPQSFDGLRFHGLFQTSSFVGGDVYDWFEPVPGWLAFHLADVSGHGVAAAMVAGNAMHLLRSAAEDVVRAAPEGQGPAALAAAIVAEANARFLRMNASDLYLTVAFGLVHIASRRGAVVRAGHPPPLLSAPGTAAFEPLGEGDVPLGMLPDIRWTAVEFALPPGARLALYSDGITECLDPAGEPFGEQRLRDLLAAHARSTPQQACQAVGEALRDWRGGTFDDDVTLAVLAAG